MMCMNHPDRDCIYQEAEAVVELKKDTENIVSIQIHKYLGENYPKNNGMIASGILYRTHNDPVVKELMNEWWNEVKLMSRRDQLSFNYVCWKKEFQYSICDLDYSKSEFFIRTPPEQPNKLIDLF